eukprot:NODE_253_length_11722_cov_0.375118.p2 type:complete len:391 gc:universal NODE_253_length_11722_cov_0.375118:4116-5288(+)
MIFLMLVFAMNKRSLAKLFGRRTRSPVTATAVQPILVNTQDEMDIKLLDEYYNEMVKIIEKIQSKSDEELNDAQQRSSFYIAIQIKEALLNKGNKIIDTEQNSEINNKKQEIVKEINEKIQAMTFNKQLFWLQMTDSKRYDFADMILTTYYLKMTRLKVEFLTGLEASKLNQENIQLYVTQLHELETDQRSEIEAIILRRKTKPMEDYEQEQNNERIKGDSSIKLKKLELNERLMFQYDSYMEPENHKYQLTKQLIDLITENEKYSTLKEESKMKRVDLHIVKNVETKKTVYDMHEILKFDITKLKNKIRFQMNRLRLNKIRNFKSLMDLKNSRSPSTNLEPLEELEASLALTGEYYSVKLQSLPPIQEEEIKPQSSISATKHIDREINL